MENSTFVGTITKIIWGGALMGVFLFGFTQVLAFDQHNTHPALTDEIVDFYNLSFPDKKISPEDKELIVRGSIDEDSAARGMNHFYDPIYDKGLWNYPSSKKWAMSSSAQLAWQNMFDNSIYAVVSEDSSSPNGVYSWPRSIQDYAKGDRKRALLGIGHVLHLLEDAGVPDHTRQDAHPSIHGMGSPFEYTMAKWNRGNFNVAGKLFRENKRPTQFGNIEDHFNHIARYSNGYFFSEDTIDIERYANPKVVRLERIPNQKIVFGLGSDKNGETFKLVSYNVEVIRNIINVTEASIYNPVIKSFILDDYWSRLSPEVVINGAGALKLFLQEAEEARKDYLAKAEQKKPSFWAQVASLFGFDGENNDKELTTSDVGATSDVNDVELSTLPTSQVGYPQVTESGDSGDTSGDNKVSPSLSPSLSPLPLVTPLVSPLVSPTPAPTKLTTPGGRGISSVKTGRVVINEIAWAGTEASTADEWIELYNTENYDIDLSGWTLKAEDGTPEIIIGGNNKELTTSDGHGTSEVNSKIIKANGYFLLERTDDTTVNSIAADQLYVGVLGNEGEVLKLSDSLGTIVDTAGNSGGAWLAGSSTGKVSMERTGLDASVGVKWKNFTGSPSAKDANGNFIYGSPKASNSQAPYVVTGTSGGNQTVSPQVSPTPTSSLTPTPTPEGDTVSSGDVIINEIAWMGTETSANHEWIELYNTTNKTINLTNWTLNSEDGTPSITLEKTVGPFNYYLLERTSDNTVPGIEADQIYTGALGNSGERLVLKDVSGTIISQVDGSNGWKINGDDKIIGDNTTKETAQRFGNVWKTAQPTPRSENKENTTAIKPSSVTSLAAAHNSPTITATWSAPDPGSYNPASLSYDLRYSTSNFPDDDTWDAATKVASSSLPSVELKGASQSAFFDVNYEYGQTLYFALKTKVINIPTCDVGNVDKCSGISNVAMVSFPSAIDDNAWGMFGKDKYHTSFAANVTGPGIGATISWTFEAINAVSQPVADAKGNIYFGVSDGTLANSKLYSIRKKGGNIVENWTYGTNVSIGTPAVLSDGTVYFGRIGAGGVQWFTALNSDGTNKWDYTDASTVENLTVSPKGEPHFTFKSGAVNNLLVLEINGSVKISKNETGLAGFAPVVLNDGTIIAVKQISGNQLFVAYKLNEDNEVEKVWEHAYTQTNGNIPANPSYDKLTGTTYSAAGPKLFSIPSNGSVLNSHDIASWDYSAATMVAVTSNTLYLGFNNKITPASGSLLYAINKSDLSTKWLAPFQADGLINKQLAIDNAGNAYFSTQNGKLYSVDNNGNQRWVINSSSNSTISPILTEDGLVWGYGSKIVRIDN